MDKEEAKGSKGRDPWDFGGYRDKCGLIPRVLGVGQGRTHVLAWLKATWLCCPLVASKAAQWQLETQTLISISS